MVAKTMENNRTCKECMFFLEQHGIGICTIESKNKIIKEVNTWYMACDKFIEKTTSQRGVHFEILSQEKW